MKLKSAVMALVLILSLSAPAYAADLENVALEVGASDIYVTVPLCTYWYTQSEGQGITPKMIIINHGFSPIAVSSVEVPGSTTTITGIPYEIIPSMSRSFRLTELPHGSIVHKHAVKQAVIFTISKIGG